MSNLARPLLERGRLRTNRELGCARFDPHTCPLYTHTDESISARLHDLCLPKDFAKRILIYGARTHTLFKTCQNLFPDAHILQGDWCESALPQETPHRLVFWEEDAPFAPQSFDIILSCLSLQVCESPPKALVHLYSLLRPGGLVLAQFVGGASLSHLREALIEADLETSLGARQRTLPMMDMQTALSLFQNAGLTGCICDEERLSFSFKSLAHMRAFLRARGAQSLLHETAPINRTFYNAFLIRLQNPFFHTDLVTCLGWHTQETFPALPNAHTS